MFGHTLARFGPKSVRAVSTASGASLVASLKLICAIGLHLTPASARLWARWYSLPTKNAIRLQRIRTRGPRGARSCPAGTSRGASPHPDRGRGGSPTLACPPLGGRTRSQGGLDRPPPRGGPRARHE